MIEIRTEIATGSWLGLSEKRREDISWEDGNVLYSTEWILYETE
jgi:hypothetical protein